MHLTSSLFVHLDTLLRYKKVSCRLMSASITAEFTKLFASVSKTNRSLSGKSKLQKILSNAILSFSLHVMSRLFSLLMWSKWQKFQ